MKKICLILFSFLFTQTAVCSAASLSGLFNAFTARPENADFLNLEVHDRAPRLIESIQQSLGIVDKNKAGTGSEILMQLFDQITALKAICLETFDMELCCADDSASGYEILVGDRFSKSKTRMLGFIENKLIPKIYADAEIN